MKRAALISRLSAALISFMYMLAVLPHFPGIEARDLSSGWFLSGMATALVWMPLLVFNHRLEQRGGTLANIFSFALVAFMTAFLGVLFAVVPRIH